MVPKINFASGLAEEDMLRLTISISLEEISTTHFSLKKDGSLGRDRLPRIKQNLELSQSALQFNPLYQSLIEQEMRERSLYESPLSPEENSLLVEDDILRLAIPVSVEEIFTTLFAMKKDGSLGPEWFPLPHILDCRDLPFEEDKETHEQLFHIFLWGNELSLKQKTYLRQQKQEVGLDVPSNIVQKMLKPWDSARITSTKSPYGWIGSGIDTTAEALCGWSRLTQAPLGHGLNYYAIEIGSTRAFYSHC
ncbi:hypothetical protein QJS10_CPA06g00608 [Acorus calamus]|uniref:Uncharacterized protein n=1 Tax=Acorus calamus TaxID=4465 RepID=A0AAV9EPI1_ACOCL|nr:hypothetical protein QJS10_CPA06g00608 [Acorus calamus]